MKDIEIAKTVNQIKESKFPTKKNTNYQNYKKPIQRPKLYQLIHLIIEHYYVSKKKKKIKRKKNLKHQTMYNIKHQKL